MDEQTGNIALWWNYIRTRWELLALIYLVIIALVIFLLYRYLFSKKGLWIREWIPFLRIFAAKRDVGELINDKEYARAGDLLESMGRHKEAIAVFTHGKLYGRAADIYMTLSQPDHAATLYEQAGDFEKAAEIYAQIKSFEKAEECLTKVDKTEEIPKMYLKHNLKGLAAQSMMRFGLYREASDLFAGEGDFSKAGQMTEELYRQEKKRIYSEVGFMDDAKVKELARIAAEHYIKAKEFDNAAKMYTDENLFIDAAKSFELSGDLDKAVDFYLKSSDHVKAAELLRKKGDVKRAAYVEAEGRSSSGDEAGAIQFYQEAGDFAKAADIYRNMQDYEKAAIMYEKAKEYSLAGSAYAEAKNFEKAAQCSEKLKDFDKAIEYYGLAGDYARQVALQEKLGKFYGAGQNYFKRGLLDEALAILEKVEEGSADRAKAISLMGKIYLEKGNLSKAKELLEKAVMDAKGISKENIDSFTNLALLAEKSDADPSFLKTIEKMLSDDMVSNDVKDKVDNIRQKLNFFALSKLSRMVAKDGSSKFADPGVMVSNVARIEKKRYVKIKEIGRGGMGIVYTAKDTTLDRVVALKILPGTLKKNPQAVKTFLREAKSAAALNHPNIVTVFDAGLEDDDYYIAMELINGLTIKEILKKSKKLSIASVIEVLRQILAGLSYAHKNNIVHRDLTTNNIMWNKEKQAKIMDFGLAKVVKDLLSEQSIIGGTPSFMSPEQTLGKPIDHRTDIYSLGICLFQMLLGELPFKKGDLGYHHLHTLPPVPKSIDATIPDPLSDIILKCMEKEPAKRFQSCEEIEKILVSQLAPYSKNRPDN